MKLFLFLLLLLAPPPPTIPTEANNNNSQVDDKNQDQDKIKALPNEEPPSLAGLFTGKSSPMAVSLCVCVSQKTRQRVNNKNIIIPFHVSMF